MMILTDIFWAKEAKPIFMLVIKIVVLSGRENLPGGVVMGMSRVLI